MSAKGSTRAIELSDLARIEGVLDHPVDLFRNWHDEARRFDPKRPDACCLATVSKDMSISARHVVLREFDNDGFVIVTDRRSRKADDLEHVPHAAMSYLWFYVNDRQEQVTRQVRVEGTMKMLQKEQFQHLYEREPLFCKIRSYVCDQGSKVDWDELKQRHDRILSEVRGNQNSLPMPDHFVGYKLLPTMIEFYYTRDYLIGDRIIYRRDKPTDPWVNHHRIAA